MAWLDSHSEGEAEILTCIALNRYFDFVSVPVPVPFPVLDRVSVDLKLSLHFIGTKDWQLWLYCVRPINL